MIRERWFARWARLQEGSAPGPEESFDHRVDAIYSVPVAVPCYLVERWKKNECTPRMLQEFLRTASQTVGVETTKMIVDTYLNGTIRSIEISTG